MQRRQPASLEDGWKKSSLRRGSAFDHENHAARLPFQIVARLSAREAAPAIALFFLPSSADGCSDVHRRRAPTTCTEDALAPSCPFAPRAEVQRHPRTLSWRPGSGSNGFPPQDEVFHRPFHLSGGRDYSSALPGPLPAGSAEDEAFTGDRTAEGQLKHDRPAGFGCRRFAFYCTCWLFLPRILYSTVSMTLVSRLRRPMKNV